MLYKQLKLEKTRKVIVSVENGIIKIQPALNFVNQVAGSFEMPDKYKNMDIDKIIKTAKESYFKEKFKNKLS